MIAAVDDRARAPASLGSRNGTDTDHYSHALICCCGKDKRSPACTATSRRKLLQGASFQRLKLYT